MFGMYVSNHSMVILLGLAYCCITPLIAPFCLVYFLMAYMTQKYQCLVRRATARIVLGAGLLQGGHLSAAASSPANPLPRPQLSCAPQYVLSHPYEASGRMWITVRAAAGAAWQPPAAPPTPSPHPHARARRAQPCYARCPPRPQIFHQIMTAVYFLQLVTAAVLAVKRFSLAVGLVPLLLLTAVFHVTMAKLFARPWTLMSLREAAALDAREASKARPRGRARGRAPRMS